MLKQTFSWSQQVPLSIYGPLLTPGIKELVKKEIIIHLTDQNFKSHLNLILFFFQAPPLVLVDSP